MHAAEHASRLRCALGFQIQDCIVRAFGIRKTLQMLRQTTRSEIIDKGIWSAPLK